jgi:acetolactate synthase-1/2/3 large subunit
MADILIEEPARQGVSHIFTLSGGGIMYLTDALGRSRVGYVCCHHEQVAGIAAQSYAMHTNGLGVCLVTTGPGGANALTACAAAYMDSTPVLFLSGQVKTADFASKRRVRQFGAQENDIVSMVRPVTKYAVLVERPEEALYALQRAIFLSMHGRRGPVWVDVPLDVQSAEVEEDALLRFEPREESAAAYDAGIAAQLTPDETRIAQGVDMALRALAASRRPLILIGHGLIASGAQERFAELAVRLGVPVVATWRALGVLDHGDPLFFGSPGLQAPRYSNMITQGADFLLVLGSRLDNMITAFSEPRFAFRARKLVVDVDANEIAKLDMPGLTPVVCDAGRFVDALLAAPPSRPVGDISAWKSFCADLRNRYPLLEEAQVAPLARTDLYRAADSISKHSAPGDVFVVSSTSRCNTAGHIACAYAKGQRPISSMAFGAMGFALPSVVGAWFASGGRRVIMLEGDGSLQLNIQELQTLRHHNINAKLFIFSNNGYAAVAAMQDRNFAGFRVGSDEASGVSMPCLERIAGAYGFPFVRIATDDALEEGIREAMDTTGPVICEILGDMHFDEIPKCISSVNEEGTRVSAALENPYPFLPEEMISTLYARLDEETTG